MVTGGSESAHRFARLTTSPELPVVRPEPQQEGGQSGSSRARVKPDELLLMGSYLRLALVGLGFVAVLILERDSWVMRFGLGSYLLVSVLVLPLLRRGLLVRWMQFALLAADVGLVTLLAYGHGIQTSSVTLLYLPLLIGYLLQRDRLLGYTALGTILAAYGGAILLQELTWLPPAPLVETLPPPLTNASGPLAAFLILTSTVCATFCFMAVAVRRLEKLAEVRNRLTTMERTATSQRLEALGRLAGGVAHDFNNLLTAISGYTEMLLGRTDLPDEAREDLDQIAIGADRAARLTTQLLAFARRQVGHPVVLDVNELIGGLSGMLLHLVGEDVRIQTSMGANLGRVEIDPIHLEQVIMNLVINARDAMPAGGTVTIATRNAEPKPGAATSTWLFEAGGNVLILISDTGQGVAPEVLPYIFEPFFSTKAEGQGTGLGLATVYGIVKQYGGQIRVKSEPGKGTTFSIYLPRSTREDQTAPEPTERVPVRTVRSQTVLLAEDDGQVRGLAQRMLEQAGYRVLVAADGSEAVQLADGYAGPIALLVTDVVMPGINGPDLADTLRRMRPDLKTLFMSGHNDDEVLRRGIAADEVEFLSKPFSNQELLQRVGRVIDGSHEQPESTR